MRYTYLLCLTLLLTSNFAWSQSGGIQAGQVSGSMYVVRPPAPLQFVCTDPYTNTCTSIDLNGDGALDLLLAKYPGSCGSQYSLASKLPSLQFAYRDSVQRPYIIRMLAGDSISSTVTQWRNHPINWVGTGFLPTLSAYGICQGGSILSADYWGTDTLTRYIGMRWKVTPTSAYQYGWLRIKGNGAPPISRQYSVAAYAGQRIVLANRKAEQITAALYPNPVTGRLTVELPTATSAHLELRDLAGRVMQQHTFPASAKAHTLSVADLPAGVYIVRVSTPMGSVVRRISKL